MASIVELVPKNLSASAEEVDVLLELAFLVTAADGRLSDEELIGFGELSKRLRGSETADVDAYLERFADALEWEAIAARVRTIAPSLPVHLHELAYKLALGLAFVDRDPHRQEDRLHAVLGESLSIPTDRRAAISRQVAIDGGRAR